MQLAHIITLTLVAGTSVAQECPWDLETTPNAEGSLLLYSIDGDATDNIWSVGRRFIFTQTDTRTLNYAARWDGSSWSEIDVPQPSELREHQVLYGVHTIGQDDAIAVGTYNPPSGASQSQTMRWDGSNWELMQSPVFTGGSGFNSIGSAGTDIWACGHKWSELPPPAASTYPMAARLNGDEWEVEFVPPLAETGGRSYNYIRAIDGAHENDAWGGGVAQEVGIGGFGPAAMLVHWDGSAWSQYDLSQIVESQSFSSITSLDVVTSDNAWAAGYDYDLARQVTIPLILHWDGNDWSNIPVPTFEHSAELRGITARSATEVFAAGTQADADGYPHALILRWDGTQWSVIPEQELTDYGTWFRTMTTVQGEVWTAGQSNGLSAGITQRLGDCVSCPADLNDDGVLDFFDVSAFLDAFNRSDPIADFTRDGLLDFFDTSAFLSAYNAGCP